MATLIFQSYRDVSREEEGSLKLQDFTLEHLGKLTTASRYWTMFRIGKQATRLVNMSSLERVELYFDFKIWIMD